MTQDIAENFLAGILLAINRPFNIGDIIQVENFKGTIKNLELRTTHIRTVDGRDIFVPNSALIKSSLINFTKDGLLRMDFGVGLATEADIEEVRRLILEHLISNDRMLKNPKPNVIVENIGTSTLDIRVLFWVDILKSKTEKPDTLGDPIRSQNIREVKNLLLANKFSLPANIFEHKMYDSRDPLVFVGGISFYKGDEDANLFVGNHIAGTVRLSQLCSGRLGDLEESLSGESNPGPPGIARQAERYDCL